MNKNSKQQTKFELQLCAAKEEGFFEAKLVNKTDQKFRIVDVMRGVMWMYGGERFYGDEKILLLAPVLPEYEITVAHLSREDLLAHTYIFIDAYQDLRNAEPLRYVAIISGLHRLVDNSLGIATLSIPFVERESDFTIHDKVKAEPDIRPQIRKMISHRLDKAVAIAAKAHAEQQRKGSDIPYIVHPFRVMHIANLVTNDEDILIACLFHDILEDAPEIYSREQMMEDFGARVVSFVDDVTKDSSIKSWRKRSGAYLEHLQTAEEGSVIVSAADKINNLNAVLIDYEAMGDKVWKKFNSNKEQQLWWYESIFAIVRRRLPESPLREAMGRQMKELRKIMKSND
jgi:hypothetical protein